MLSLSIVTTRFRPRTAHERIQARLRKLIDQEREKPANLRKNQVRLAEELRVAKSTINEMLESAPQQGLLYHLDRIATFYRTTPAELVRGDNSPYMELTPLEARIIAHIRQFPTSVQEQILSLYDYFGGLLPEEKQRAEWWLKLRRLSAERRQAVERTLDAQYAAQIQSQREKGSGPAAPASGGERRVSTGRTTGKTQKTERAAANVTTRNASEV